MQLKGAVECNVVGLQVKYPAGGGGIVCVRVSQWKESARRRLARQATQVIFVDVEEREENLDVEEREKERERGSNLRRQRLASPTAQVLVAQTTQPVQKNRLRDEL